MRRAARLGDGWMPYLYSARRYADSVAKIRRFADAAGRDLSAFEWFAFVFVNVDDDADRARQATTEFLGGTYRQDLGDMLDRVAIVGTPDDVAAGLREFVRAGARHLVLAPATRAGALDLAAHLADVVLPRVAVAAASR